MTEPKQATAGQALAGLTVMGVVFCTPVASFFLMPRTPWWAFVAAMVVVSALVFLIGTGILMKIMPPGTVPAKDPKPDDDPDDPEFRP